MKALKHLAPRWVQSHQSSGRTPGLLESHGVIPEVVITVITGRGCGRCSRLEVTSHTLLCQFCGDGLAGVYSSRQFKSCTVLLLMGVGRSVSSNLRLKKYKMWWCLLLIVKILCWGDFLVFFLQHTNFTLTRWEFYQGIVDLCDSLG